MHEQQRRRPNTSEEKDKENFSTSIHSVRSKDSLFEILQGSDNYGDIYDHRVHKEEDDDEGNASLEEVLSPLSGIAAPGFFDKRQERSTMSGEVYISMILIYVSHWHLCSNCIV
jgi:hypothetical protein